MRVSTSMIYAQLTDKLSANAGSLAKAQGALSSGVKYSRPSEAAGIVGRVQALEARLSTLEADVNAVSKVRTGVDAQSKSLQSVSTLMDRLKELAFEGANDPQPQSQLDSIAEEVNGVKRALVDLANTRDADNRYVFGGSRSGAPPYELKNDGTVDYVGATTPLRVQINDVDFADATTFGPATFRGVTRGTESIEFFDALDQFQAALKSGDLAGRQQALSDVEKLGNNIGVAVSRTGAAMQRLEIAEQQATEITTRAKESLSSLKDLDYATAL
ncbi:MAG: Flagellar hook-associated protein 3, partial [Pseudomonadota bacterium]